MIPNPQYIFWDWHGVLGTSGFWHKSSTRDVEVERLVEYIFRDKATVTRWMRSETSIDELIVQSGARITKEKLATLFRDDWRETEAINISLFSVIRSLFPKAEHIIVTDNMDVFDEYTLENRFLADNFSHIFSSSTYRFLKDDRPGLFEAAQEKLGLESFENCLLLDDSQTNCRRFEELGGTAILVEAGRTI